MSFGVVDAVTHDEDIVDREADEIGSDFDLSTARLIDQRAGLDREGLRP